MYEFVPIVPGGSGGSHHEVAVVTVGKTGLYFNRLASDMVNKTGGNFTQALVSVDMKSAAIGFHFNKGANRVKNNYKLQRVGQAGRNGMQIAIRISNKIPEVWQLLTSRYPGKTNFTFPLKPCFIISQDFYVIDLKEEMNHHGA